MSDYSENVKHFSLLSNPYFFKAEDIEIVLPPEKMDVLARDADKWLEKQKDRVMEQRKKSVRLIESRKKGQEVKRKYLASGIGLGEEDRMP